MPSSIYTKKEHLYHLLSFTAHKKIKMQYDWNLGTDLAMYAKSFYENEEWFEATHFYSQVNFLVQ